jgi:hypothetical protein
LYDDLIYQNKFTLGGNITSETYNVTEIWIEKSSVANSKIIESTQLSTDEVLLKINYIKNT